MHKLPVVFLVVGILVAVLAVIIGFQVFPSILKKKISEQSRLVNGTAKWASWKEAPIPVFQRLYIFNVTNPSEVKNGGKPILVELGPYIYQHRRKKVDISVHEEKDTVTYRHHDDYFYRAELSKGSLDDRITVLNLPYLGAAYKSMQAGSIARSLIRDVFIEQFPDEDMYISITVGEFLFGGYYVPFMQELSELKGEQLMPNNTFGIYYGKNGSESLIYEVHAGVQNPAEFGKVLTFNGKTSLGIFEDEKCDQVRGYDGSMIPPFLTKDREFTMFVPALCREMRFVFNSEVDMMGVPAYKYTVPKKHLADVETNPDNMCYCSNPPKCLKGGAWELSFCKQGTPMVMSFPHFYDGAEEYQQQSVGLNPQQNKHEMVVVFEPTAAISLQVAIRAQMNFALTPSKYFPPLKKVPEMLHPIFWMDQGVTLPAEMVGMIKGKLIKTQEYAKLGTYFGIGLGAVFIIAALVIFWCKSSSVKKSNNYKPKKASFSKMSSPEKRDSYMESENQKVSNERYSKIAASPPNGRPSITEKEKQPFLSQNGAHSHPVLKVVPTPVVPNTHAGVVRMDSNPVVVGMHPKADESRDEVDNSVSSPLGVPFPKYGEFSSSTSMNNELQEIDNTLKDINETVSSYENLK